MIPSTMNAVEVDQAGGTEQLICRKVPVPQVGSGQILVKNIVAGVNFYDTYVRSGVYNVRYPHRPGIDGSGIVVATASDVADVHIGQPAAYWASITGGYAEYVLMNREHLLPVSPHLDLHRMGALPTQGLTAHMLIDGTYNVTAQTQMFITAGAGGVGNLAIQLGRARGARIITSVSTEEKARHAYKAGADVVILYRGLSSEQLSNKIRAATEDHQGVHVAFDGVGNATFDSSLAAVRPRGTVVLFGGASGQVPAFDIQRLNSAGSLFLTRPSLQPYMATTQERNERWGAVADAVSDGELTVHIGATFPLAEAGKAHRLIESGTSTGKILLEF